MERNYIISNYIRREKSGRKIDVERRGEGMGELGTRHSPSRVNTVIVITENPLNEHANAREKGKLAREGKARDHDGRKRM